MQAPADSITAAGLLFQACTSAGQKALAAAAAAVGVAAAAAAGATPRCCLRTDRCGSQGAPGLTAGRAASCGFRFACCCSPAKLQVGDKAAGSATDRQRRQGCAAHNCAGLSCVAALCCVGTIVKGVVARVGQESRCEMRGA